MVAQDLPALFGQVPRDKDAVGTRLRIVEDFVRQLSGLGEGEVEAREFVELDLLPVVDIGGDDLLPGVGAS